MKAPKKHLVDKPSTTTRCGMFVIETDNIVGQLKNCNCNNCIRAYWRRHPLTKKVLESYLKKIGWSIESSHNGLNHFILNPLGERSALVVGKDFLEVRINIFGGTTSMGKGVCHFPLDRITISEGNVLSDNAKPSDYITINFSEHNWIQLYKKD